jgi:putative transposase
MPNYRRSWVPGGTYFFTVVTWNRRPILTHAESRELLRTAWREVNQRLPFTTLAICLLPDHLHCVWSLPEGDANYAMRWREIKRLFSRQYIRRFELEDKRNASRVKRNEAAIWQRRFWEHTLRDEADLQRHVDYIHYNPVKHGLVKNVADWPWSSFSRYVRSGFYESSWGQGIGEQIKEMETGE